MLRARISRFGGGGAHRLVMLWAMLFALAWQGFVVQPHRHLDPDILSTQAAVVHASERGPVRDAPFDSPAKCPICFQIAHAGPALLPHAITIVAPAPQAFWAIAAHYDARPLSGRSHRWQSRAPPFQLQA